MRCLASPLAISLWLIFTGGCMAAPPIPVGRSDLAAVYLEFETAYAAAALTDDAQVAEFNRGFDRASLMFFNGQVAPVILELQSLIAQLPRGRDDAAARVARSLKVTSDPPTVIAGKSSDWTLRITSMYEVQASDAHATKCALKLRGSGADVVFSIEWTTGELVHSYVDSRVDIGALSATISPGLYDVVIESAGGFSRRIGRVQVVSRSLDEQRVENAAALEQIRSDDAAIQAALVSCKARNAQLADQPMQTASLPLLFSMEEWAKQVAAEVRSLRESRNPYSRRVGDSWRVIADAGGEYPCRVYAPREAVGDQPLPLLIALHGAGGDENMFFEGYGAGLIKKLADENKFITVTPLSYPFTLNPGLVDRLIEMLEIDYAIDRDRVYLLGHSLGVVAANSILTTRASRFAGVAAMAGAISLVGATTPPPVLVISGALDPLSRPDRVRAAVESARSDGVDVEWRESKAYGHTLLVGARLREAVDWLLAKRRRAD